MLFPGVVSGWTQTIQAEAKVWMFEKRFTRCHQELTILTAFILQHSAGGDDTDEADSFYAVGIEVAGSLNRGLAESALFTHAKGTLGLECPFCFSSRTFFSGELACAKSCCRRELTCSYPERSRTPRRRQRQ